MTKFKYKHSFALKYECLLYLALNYFLPCYARDVSLRDTGP